MVNRRVSKLLILLAFSASLTQTASPMEIATAGRMLASIQSSNFLPREYRERVNIALHNHSVTVSTYRDAESDETDCKIDSILLTRKIIDIDPDLKHVEVAFYDVTQDSKYWLAEVPAAAVKAYGAGKISREEVLGSVSLSERQVHLDNIARAYGRMSYNEIVKRLGIVDGPLRQQRTAVVVRMNSLQENGFDIGELRKHQLHLEDLARRRDIVRLEAALKEMNRTLASLGRRSPRISQLDALVSSKPQPVSGLMN